MRNTVAIIAMTKKQRAIHFLEYMYFEIGLWQFLFLYSGAPVIRWPITRQSRLSDGKLGNRIFSSILCIDKPTIRGSDSDIGLEGTKLLI